MSNVRIGTAGWNYPTGHGTWNGVFYPKPRDRARSFDELAFYAEHFDTVEVNSTFYGPPRPEVTRQWADRTSPGFEFSLKLYQKFTHPRMFRERLEGSLPLDAPHTESRTTDDFLVQLAKPNLADVDTFKRGMDPLAARGKLGVLLAQFPASFHNTAAGRAYLASLLQVFSDYPVAVELRHKTWSDSLKETLSLLNAFRAAWVQIDEPRFSFSITQDYLPNIDGFYYMRLHGRNAEQWWRHKTVEDRYNYLYSGDELREFTSTLDAARHIVKKAYLYTNNHFSAKSVANAVMIKQQLGEPIAGEYPESFLKQFPDLRGVAPAYS